MVKRGLQSGSHVAQLLTADLRRARLLPPKYQIVSRCAGAGPIQVLYLVCEGEGEAVFVGFSYQTAWRAIEERGVEAIWGERLGD